ncbi:MAG: phenylacetate--CoA ligase, partial [Geobacter sp.]|nr:phenylacetate--CoA ligase [Geobacter sp.]
MEIWDKEFECMDREAIEELQLERLQATLHRAYKNVTCYRNKFDSQGIDPDDIKSLSDLAKLP